MGRLEQETPARNNTPRKLPCSVRAAMSRADDKLKHRLEIFHELRAVSEWSEKDHERYLRTRSSVQFIV